MDCGAGIWLIANPVAAFLPLVLPGSREVEDFLVLRADLVRARTALLVIARPL